MSGRIKRGINSFTLVQQINKARKGGKHPLFPMGGLCAALYSEWGGPVVTGPNWGNMLRLINNSMMSDLWFVNHCVININYVASQSTPINKWSLLISYLKYLLINYGACHSLQWWGFWEYSPNIELIVDEDYSPKQAFELRTRLMFPCYTV